MLKLAGGLVVGGVLLGEVLVIIYEFQSKGWMSVLGTLAWLAVLDGIALAAIWSEPNKKGEKDNG